MNKIVSGGQTGVDLGAIDACLTLNFPYSGFVPKGKFNENGIISDKYNYFIEASTRSYKQRTELNVDHSDGTLIITKGSPFGGTKLTLDFVQFKKKPFFVIDLNKDIKLDIVIKWIEFHNIKILNVAGPRESKFPGIQNKSKNIIESFLEKLQNDQTL